MAEIRIVDALRAEIKNIDSKVNLLTQEMRNIKKNEEILGRTIVTLNEKLAKIEASGGGPGGQVLDTEQNKRLDELREQVNKMSEEHEAIKNTLEQVKYTLDMINPLEFVTVRQVNELVEEKVGEVMRQTAKKKKTDE